MRAWNGGSRERAMEIAAQRRDKMLEQGASTCAACGGEGALDETNVCPQCTGSGVILPAGGLQIPVEITEVDESNEIRNQK